jgi:coproporphyrinogen III oxidase
LDRSYISSWFKNLQDDICLALENADGTAKFKTDNWQRNDGGGGRSRIIEAGKVIEKGGVNFSEVFGNLPQNIKNALKVNGDFFYATGVSIVMHPHNPFVPIIHMNVRYFEISDAIDSSVSNAAWFGGGIDLTPHYIFVQDAKYFHEQLKHSCDKFDPSYYPLFKKWADDYFFNKHRNETRGVGGIFFDRLAADDKHTLENRFDFVKEIGSSFAPIYTHLMSKFANNAYDETNKQWQLMRRGRYVEFNLVYDKGTKFGLDTNGRIESILMSLPPLASWLYDFKPSPNSMEEKTLNLLKKDLDWVNM